ncbi:MAG: hypothetical protein ACW99H_12545 [Candidatus Thorarchaeota archaeon]|jgi:hypothetical protein
MTAVADLMKGYYSDKNTHPWHTIYKDIEKYWHRYHPKKDVKETLILLRDAVFGALEILSLSIALDVPTVELVTLFTKEPTWKEGRRQVRNKCIELVEQLTKKKKTRYLISSAIKRDGFGFLVSGIEDAELETFKKAKPKMKKVPRKKKQILDLAPLEKSQLGSRFLREQMVMETQIEKGDSRIPTILEAYDHFLVELEIDMSSSIPEPVPTEQVTLNGTPVTDSVDEKAVPSKKPRGKVKQSPLTDFIEEKPAAKKKKSKKPSAQKKRRAKKK